MNFSLKRAPERFPHVSVLDGSGLFFLVAGAAFFLNHTVIIGRFNLSIADAFLVGLLFTLVVSSRLYFTRFAVLFFLVVLAVGVSTSLFITPSVLGTTASPRSILGDVIKLVISFFYFNVGVSIARLGLHNIAIKWFAIGSAGVAALAVGMEILGFSILEDTLYYGGLRYRGFMSDPNFYSILSCVGFVYFSYSSTVHIFLRIAALLVLGFSVILSGSKTGLVALVTILFVILCTRALQARSTGRVLLFLLAGAVTIVSLNSIREWLASWVHKLSDDMPQLDRTSALLSDDFSTVLSGDGSSREAVWSVGLQIIETSPIFGVGIGSYGAVAGFLFDHPALAHNTYIQLSAEWGLVLAFVLFLWLTILLGKATLSTFSRQVPESLLILRDTVIVFMIGSVSLSLNNARMLWFFLGMFAFVCLCAPQFKAEKQTL